MLPTDPIRSHYLRPALKICALLFAAAFIWPSPSAVDGAEILAISDKLPIAEGEFKPTAESLQTYQCPTWYRDAKFGIWSHWGPQAVPRQGDWYARNMYLPGHRHYDHHLKTYGHPSEHGYKDIIPLWKAEKWEPEQLMQLYAKAGAKYFVSMAVHHDNFCLWDAKSHPWKATTMGPHRNVVAEWQKAAKQEGLRFGVSEHLGASYTWWWPNKGFDQFGPKSGVAYDGANPEFAALYHTNYDEPFRWGKTWYANNPEWHKQWFHRIKDLIDQHHPDLIYTDGGIPFGKVGESLIAHYYNTNAADHDGQLEAVYTYKAIGSGDSYAGAGIFDIERGVMPEISDQPWQTCTSIGDWYYSEGYKYKTTTQVVQMLADVVSKNGNLLINIVQYPEGDLPPECQKFLDEMAVWIEVNGDAIYGTRPWIVFGEGPTETKSGHFQEGTAYTAKDIRFTTKDGIVNAIALGIPSGETRIKSLGRLSTLHKEQVAKVTVLGSSDTIDWSQEDDSLVIQPLASWPTDHAVVFQVHFASDDR